MKTLTANMRAQWTELDRRIRAFDAEFVAFLRENADARRLSTIPGVGSLIASAQREITVVRSVQLDARPFSHQVLLDNIASSMESYSRNADVTRIGRWDAAPR
jgi:hypothetical protein